MATSINREKAKNSTNPGRRSIRYAVCKRNWEKLSYDILSSSLFMYYKRCKLTGIFSPNVLKALTDKLQRCQRHKLNNRWRETASSLTQRFNCINTCLNLQVVHKVRKQYCILKASRPSKAWQLCSALCTPWTFARKAAWTLWRP